MISLPNNIIDEFKGRFCKEIDVEAVGINEYAVFTPFTFDDGDHFVIHLLANTNGTWRITDRGHTFFHVSYSDLDFSQGRRRKIIEDAIGFHGLFEESGELYIDVDADQLGFGLYSFIHALSKIANTTKITREFVRSTFYEDLSALIYDSVPERDVVKDWHDEESDPHKRYIADYRIQINENPLFVFGVHSNEKCLDTTIFCLQTEKRFPDMDSMAIFEDQTAINRLSVAKLSDVVGKQFSTLEDTARIKRFLQH